MHRLRLVGHPELSRNGLLVGSWDLRGAPESRLVRITAHTPTCEDRPGRLVAKFTETLFG
jgi:hypothetical protein